MFELKTVAFKTKKKPKKLCYSVICNVTYQMLLVRIQNLKMNFKVLHTGKNNLWCRLYKFL